MSQSCRRPTNRDGRGKEHARRAERTPHCRAKDPTSKRGARRKLASTAVIVTSAAAGSTSRTWNNGRPRTTPDSSCGRAASLPGALELG